MKITNRFVQKKRFGFKRMSLSIQLEFQGLEWRNKMALRYLIIW